MNVFDYATWSTTTIRDVVISELDFEDLLP